MDYRVLAISAVIIFSFVGCDSESDVGGSGDAALRTDDTVECWGDYENAHPDPGDTFVDISIAGTSTTTAVGACGITTEGTLECWADQGEEQDLDLPQPNENFEEVVIGEALQGCARRTNGDWECWGYYETPWSEMKDS